MILLYTASLTTLGSLYFAWWWIVIAPFIVAFWRFRSFWRSVTQAFLGSALSWAIPAWYMDKQNGSLLSNQLSQLFHLPGHFGLLLVTVAFAGTMGALGGLAGNRLRATVNSALQN